MGSSLEEEKRRGTSRERRVEERERDAGEERESGGEEERSKQVRECYTDLDSLMINYRITGNFRMCNFFWRKCHNDVNFFLFSLYFPVSANYNVHKYRQRRGEREGKRGGGGEGRGEREGGEEGKQE